MKTREDKRMVKLDFLFLFQNCLFGTYIRSNDHVFTYSLHLVRGPKGFVNLFFKKLDHGSWPMVRLHGP